MLIFTHTFVLSVKPGSYFLRMRMRYECWRRKFATNNSQGLTCAQLSCEYRSENRVVTSNSCQIRITFAFAGSMNQALVSSLFVHKLVTTSLGLSNQPPYCLCLSVCLSSVCLFVLALSFHQLITTILCSFSLFLLTESKFRWGV